MAPSKLRKAIGAVKDQTSISLAKVGSSASLSDLDVAIVKATRHEEYPPEERHIREILCLTCYSRVHVAACVNTISRRLSKTKNWVVALKSLILIQRLLAEGDPAYEREIFFATCRGTRLLNMSDFRDTSKSNSWDYSAFVRTYALYLDEQLEFGIQQRRGKQSTYAYREEEDENEEEETGAKAMVVKGTPVKEMSNEQVFSRAHHLIQLLERFLACRPTGYARHNRVISIALYPIVKESFQLYYDITELLEIFIDRFLGLDVPTSVKVHDLFCRISKQYDDLDSFYTWCNTAGIARSSEYPDVEKIPQKKLDVMDEFIKEKSLMSQKCRAIEANPEPIEEEEMKPEDDDQDDVNTIKALPPPEGLVNEPIEQEKMKGETEVPKEEEVVTNNTRDVGDLLNLGEDTEINTEKQENALALALFDGNLSTSSAPTSTISPWEAFKDSGDNWETALIQSASHLPNQTANLPGGFDTLMLDGMYKQGEIALEAASSGLISTGSASSVAIGSAGKPSMLALPAPPSTEGGPASSSANNDPFAASLVVAPPPYVQMSEMEKKQRLLVEEQVAWQQYARDGMQGQVGLANVHYQNTYPYNYAGGYHQTY